MPANATVRSAMRATADGAYPTDRWREGDHIRERFTVTIPSDWKTTGVTIGLTIADAAGNRIPPTGPTPTNDTNTFALGVLPLVPSAGSPPPK